MNLKFGVIYAQNGQFTDDEFFSNTQGSPEFENFLDLLGDRITLKGSVGFFRSQIFNSNLAKQALSIQIFSLDWFCNFV